MKLFDNPMKSFDELVFVERLDEPSGGPRFLA
jgi:hypothetical protein